MVEIHPDLFVQSGLGFERLKRGGISRQGLRHILERSGEADEIPKDTGMRESRSEGIQRTKPRSAERASLALAMVR